ncbi:uncharacterized protein LOC141816815 [Curcuma longa]|uniref:uncharacterized protein LOC141816815 n=1 Tax=Curcuma longa TaxID=136217 RepID=UPI003D9E0898
MDAYQGYHQVPLAKEDQEKVSFVTADGTFCYTVMPFGLKNAGATYQRLMDRVFRHQIGRNIEVYVDDILVKSARADLLITDLEETFHTLRQYSLKLNPKKCLFGVKSGCFLGYIVLRRATRFSWDDKCDKAFVELKQYLADLPTLAKPEPQEPLWVYLVGLRITVLTNSNLGRVLLKPDVSGWLIKWMTELSEYDIQYLPRTAIKAQALAKFLTEVTGQESSKTWKIYVDGSATKKGSGVDILLHSPQGDVLQVAIKLKFRATNNEAEYEALLAGLQAAKYLGANRVIIYSDSQLVDQQIKGTFEIRSDQLKHYAEAVDKLKAGFQEVIRQKIP